MTQINIQGSKVEQLNGSGNNYKLVSKDGNNAVSEKGNIVLTAGTANKVEVDHQESFWIVLFQKIKTLWNWIKWMVG